MTLDNVSSISTQSDKQYEPTPQCITSSQVDSTTPFAKGVLLSTKLSCNRKAVMTVGTMFFIIFLCYSIPFSILTIFYNKLLLLYVDILATIVLLCIFGPAILLNYPKRAEIYSDHLEVSSVVYLSLFFRSNILFRFIHSLHVDTFL